MYAEVTLFDPQTVNDRETYQKPHQYPEGIIYVIVNGLVTIDEGEYTGALAGRVMKKR